MKDHLISYLYILVLENFIVSQTKNPDRAPTAKLPDSSTGHQAEYCGARDL